MPGIAHRRPSLTTAFLAALVPPLLATSALAQESRCPVDDPKVAAVAIAVDATAGSVTVTPGSVEIDKDASGDRPNRVCWSVVGLEAGLELRFEDKDPDSPNYFPSMPRTVTAQAPFANSGNAARVGTWRYGVVVRDGSGGTVAAVDPEVIVRGGGR